MSKIREKIKLTSYDELLKVDSADGFKEVEIDNLIEFRNHPFKVIDDEKMDELIDSIKERGILSPILVRELGDKYEVISGHRRMHAAEKVGLDTVPVIIRELTDEDATIIMVDANIQREEILPSERAFAFKMKLDAVNHKGIKGTSSRELVGESSGISGRQVTRYIKLTELIPELLDMVDEKKITITVANEIADLSKEEQQEILDYLNIGYSVNEAQLKAIKNKEMAVDDIPQPDKKEKTKVTIPEKKLYKYFPENYTRTEMENIIYQLLEKWKSEGYDI